MAEDYIVWIPASIFLKSKNASELIEKVLDIFYDQDPEGAKNFEMECELMRDGIGRCDIGMMHGAIPSFVYYGIKRVVKDFWRDPANVKTFFQVYKRACYRKDEQRVAI